MTLRHSKTRIAIFSAIVLVGGLVGTALTVQAGDGAGSNSPRKAQATTVARAEVHQVDQPAVHHKTVKIDGLDIFYREAGPKDAPTVLLLHGFPTSSHMFRKLIPALADRFHVVAPDYPGYGNSSMPTVDEFEYTFDSMADIVETLTVKLGL